MPKTEIRLDHDGWREVLNSTEAKALVHTFAEGVAGSERATLPAGTDVAVDDYTTDRAASSVTIRDARGKLWVVRDGALIRSAAQHGAEVTARQK